MGKSIKWDYRCGWSSETSFERVYKAEINGTTIYKVASRNKTVFSIGIEKNAKNEFASEEELVKALEKK